MKTFFTIGLLLASITIFAQEYHAGKYLVTEENIALHGYDPVSYHQQSGPAAGDKSFQLEYDGAIFLFSSDENRSVFQENPMKYLPKYGGFCAYGMGMQPSQFPQGRYKTSPDAYKIIEGELYLFYPTAEWPALDYWNQNEAFFKERADKFWETNRSK